jgi:hypothetical protein
MRNERRLLLRSALAVTVVLSPAWSPVSAARARDGCILGSTAGLPMPLPTVRIDSAENLAHPPPIDCGRPATANGNEELDCDAHDFAYNHPIVAVYGATPQSNTNVDGVEGTLQIPSWTSENLRGQADTAADVVMNIEDAAGHFFQLGWYLSDGTGQLEKASVPMAFFGEGRYDDIGDEQLTTLHGVPLAPGWHTFRIIHINTPDPEFDLRYAAYVDGAPVWTSTDRSTIEGTPSVVGEANWDCADMYVWAVSPDGGPALSGHHVNGHWSFWQQHKAERFNSATNLHCWADGKYNQQSPTEYAWDQC